MDAKPNLPLIWILLLAIGFAIGDLAGAVALPAWLVFAATGLVVIAAAIHWFNLFGGCPKDRSARSARPAEGKIIEAPGNEA
jgi:hypothetical protein